jgi:predicted hydrocarbon binding protein
MSNSLEEIKSEEYLMINKAVFNEITHSIVDFFGKEGAALISYLGLSSGRMLAKQNLTISENDALKAIELMINLKRNQNWADLETIDVNEKECTGKIWVKSCFCQNEDIHDCYYLRGFLTGFLSEIFQMKISVRLDLSSLITNNSYKLLFQPQPKAVSNTNTITN